MHFYDGMYFLWLFWGLINDDNFPFFPSKLFRLGDEGILPYLSFLREELQHTCQTPKGRDSEPRAGLSSEKWVKRQQ